MTQKNDNRLHELATAALTQRVETASVFECHAEEAELNARLERTGQQWRFNVEGKIELYYPQKLRPGQKPPDVGLFDLGSHGQSDIVDLLRRSR